MPDYKATTNLPKTEFAMKAGLPAREPGMLEHNYEIDLYHKMLQRNEGKPKFILHDGPPFSNGYIHMGTTLNKCLKDFIIRYKSMTGYQTPYTPGWDNHGMPIESAIIKQQKLNRKQMSIPDFRNACRDFAADFVEKQMAQFKRLGVVGDWEHPYLTMDPAFEAEEVKIFGEMYQKGYIYKGKKPVYWCPSDETALAEAEIEYQDDPVTTIYVKFKVLEDQGKLAAIGAQDACFVIWTTTTWTLPGNQAICLNAHLDYSVVKASNGEIYIMAQELAESVLAKAGLQIVETLATWKGSEFEWMVAKHPLLDQTSLVILGDHVTLDAGTGCVHTAPAYGADDFMICRNYPQIETGAAMPVNVDDNGCFNAYAGPYAGLHVQKAHEPIYNDLVACGALLHSEEIVHSYPHCWRCKKPIIFRATDQWFCSVEAFKDQAVQAARSVKWNPEWGGERMESMIRERADWCISRQRHWGLPIPVFYCNDCGKPVCTLETIDSVSRQFGQRGSNAWFELESEELLPQGFRCPHCGGIHFTKETDTLDGWFDSGSTHIASMERNAPGCWPADLYLEGGDQYRGWFQSSLLTGVAVKGAAPYRMVLTHGWTVDGEGRAMHKSLGNSITPDMLIPKYGADVIRLWAASADYHLDMRCSDNIFKQLSDKYLKIRNTARYILGNLNGYDPNAPVPYAEMTELDQWALVKLGDLIRRCIKAYEDFEFHAVTYAIHNFCVVEMSSFYLDIIKDRLYCEAADSLARRSAQTAIYTILDALVRLLAPVLAFTSDEIWQAMPHKVGDHTEHVMLNDMPVAEEAWSFTESQTNKWDLVMKLRADVLRALEAARAEKVIGKPLDAAVALYFDENGWKNFETICEMDLKTLFIVSDVTAEEGNAEGMNGENFQGVTIVAKACDAPKCARCWSRDPKVDPRTELCPRCAAVLKL